MNFIQITFHFNFQYLLTLLFSLKSQILYKITLKLIGFTCNGILFKLIKHEFSTNLVRIISSYLSNRKFSVQCIVLPLLKLYLQEFLMALFLGQFFVFSMGPNIKVNGWKSFLYPMPNIFPNKKLKLTLTNRNKYTSILKTE